MEKRLICDSSVITEEKTAHVVTDLSACYDRQLVNVSSILLESTGINRQVTRLFAKILPSFNHHICSGFSISKQSYRSPSNHYSSIGQGNSLSGESCKA